MQRTRWIDRKFELGIPEGWVFNIMERLKGTGVRLRELTAGISDERASYKPVQKWSIKEHIGHLTDLEELHEGRIDDFLDRKDILRAADMTNAKTNAANHNSKKIPQLIDEFIVSRNALLSRLETLDDETQSFRSMHPRLQVLMKPVDMAFFMAEHDDHHLASIREIISHRPS